MNIQNLVNLSEAVGRITTGQVRKSKRLANELTSCFFHMQKLYLFDVQKCLQCLPVTQKLSINLTTPNSVQTASKNLILFRA